MHPQRIAVVFAAILTAGAAWLPWADLPGVGGVRRSGVDIALVDALCVPMLVAALAGPRSRPLGRRTRLAGIVAPAALLVTWTVAALADLGGPLPAPAGGDPLPPVPLGLGGPLLAAASLVCAIAALAAGSPGEPPRPAPESPPADDPAIDRRDLPLLLLGGLPALVAFALFLLAVAGGLAMAGTVARMERLCALRWTGAPADSFVAAARLLDADVIRSSPAEGAPRSGAATSLVAVERFALDHASCTASIVGGRVVETTLRVTD